MTTPGVALQVARGTFLFRGKKHENSVFDDGQYFGQFVDLFVDQLNGAFAVSVCLARPPIRSVDEMWFFEE